jgi:hypothetical protein
MNPMELLMPTLILSVIILFLAITGIAIRILVLKNGTFRGSCSSNNPYMQKEGVDCPVCGKPPEKECIKKDDKL